MNKFSVITIKVTDLCNFNCSYCFERKELKNRPSVFNKEKELLQFLKKFDYEDRVKIQLFGGEIFLYPDRIRSICKEIKKLERFKDVRLEFSFVTNGSLPQNMITLIKEDIFTLDNCKISYDGSLSHYTRNVKNSDPDIFNSISMNNNIEVLAPYCKDNVLISMAITNDNISTLDYTYLFLNELGYKKFEYYFIFNKKEMKEYNTSEFKKEFYDQLKRIIKYYDKYNMKLHNYELYKGTYDYANQCRTLGKQLYINTNGDIWPCPLFDEMWYLNTDEPNSNSGNISDIDSVNHIIEAYDNIKQSVDFYSKEFCQDIIDCQYKSYCNTCPLEIISFKKSGKYCPINTLREIENEAFMTRG